jgi:hypothetical protein
MSWCETEEINPVPKRNMAFSSFPCRSLPTLQKYDQGRRNGELDFEQSASSKKQIDPLDGGTLAVGKYKRPSKSTDKLFSPLLPPSSEFQNSASLAMCWFRLFQKQNRGLICFGRSLAGNKMRVTPRLCFVSSAPEKQGTRAWTMGI